jgi:antirestriction protein ArdC
MVPAQVTAVESRDWRGLETEDQIMGNTVETPRIDIYTRVTNRIVEDLERGVRPWTKPWSVGNAEGRITRPLRHNSEPYSGINVVLLWSEAVTRGFANATWMTFRQALSFGAHVRKGETGSLVVYANRIVRSETGDDGSEIEREIPFLKAYTVFNVEQIDGLDANYYAPASQVIDPVERIAHAEEFFATCRPDIRHAGTSAYYAPHPDYVQMPPFETFKDAESYYATLGHEMTHWTRHPSRLDRDLGRQRWGDEGYAREELVAELGAAFLCADLGLALEPRDDHASYIASWLEVLKQDKRFVFTAAAHAQRAADYLHRLQPLGESQAAE